MPAKLGCNIRSRGSVTATIFLTHNKIPIFWVPQFKWAQTLVVGNVQNNKMKWNLVTELYFTLILHDFLWISQQLNLKLLFFNQGWLELINSFNFYLQKEARKSLWKAADGVRCWAAKAVATVFPKRKQALILIASRFPQGNSASSVVPLCSPASLLLQRPSVSIS